MNKIIIRTKRVLSIGFRFTTLVSSILATGCKRVMLQFRKDNTYHAYLQEFIDKKVESGCNLTSLYETLKDKADDRLRISSLVNKQKTYTSRHDLLKMLPNLDAKVQIIAVPIAIKAFSFFRHFVTILIDRKSGLIEFYDPIGFTIFQYSKATLWGPLCEKSNLLSLSELIAYIKNKYQIEEIIENTEIHQKDFHQCALFVYDRIYKRGVKGYCFKKASKSPLNSNQAFI